MDKKMRNRILNRKGLTFVEVMICILILSIIAIAFLSLTNVSLKSIFTAGSKGKALAAVTEKSDRVYAIIIGAEDAQKAEDALRAEEGWVEGELYLDTEKTGAQFYYNRTSYVADGNRSVGFDVVVVAFYGSGNKTELASFVLKTAEGE
ncbi:MAG: prepilin-type N-terminal cleavage/methylation domain-containing protein [Eubacteriales bacterium]|jgi:prepilin-type N-terminal cleavage/methylation domain-containing protein